MATIVILPCQFVGAAAWARVRPLVEAAGHTLLALDLPGWGDRRSVLAPDIDLSAHVADVVQVLVQRDLRDITLVGHSYGGMVLAGVAAQATPRLDHLVLLDAPAPRHGDTLFDHLPESVAAWCREQAEAVGDGWRIPPPDLAMHHLGDADIAWLTPMLGPVPLATCEEPLEAPDDPLWVMPRTYVRCREYPMFAETAARIRNDQGWTYRELPTGHLPMVTHPAQTAALLVEVAGG
ncbi:MAG: alpha/beta fold hydrolase [Gemmatimonadales bacterium]